MRSGHVNSYLFYDVLSGKFAPPTDPQGRVHTLARLVVATFQKGAPESSAHNAMSYRPSWAPGSIATAYALPSGELSGLRISQDLPGASRDRNYINVRLQPPRGMSGWGIHVEDPTSYEFYSRLGLGPDLQDLQEEVAGMAQGFYDRLHTATEALPEDFRARLLSVTPPQA